MSPQASDEEVMMEMDDNDELSGLAGELSGMDAQISGENEFVD